MDLEEALDLIDSIKNRCEIVEALEGVHGRPLEWFHTLFEDIYEDAQGLVEFCVVKE